MSDTVRAVDLSHPDGLHNCAPGPQREWVMAFSFEGRADVDVWYSETGCALLSNGAVAAVAVSGQLNGLLAVTAALAAFGS